MSDLAEFFRKKKAAIAQLEPHREKVLHEWLEALEKLAQQLMQWLEPAMNEGLTVKRCSPISLKKFLHELSRRSLAVV